MYDRIIKMVEYLDPFAFSRFGDGEFAAIFQHKDKSGNMGSNCDGHFYYRDLGEKLKDILESRPDYYIGIQNAAKRQFGDSKEFQRLIDFPHYIADIFHYANIKEGGLHRLFKVLKGKNIVLVAPKYSERIKEFKKAHIYVPEHNCWLDKDRILTECIKNLRRNRIFLFMAGMTTNYLIDECWKVNKECIYIDIGAALDPYCGKQTREYHKTFKPAHK